MCLTLVAQVRNATYTHSVDAAHSVISAAIGVEAGEFRDAPFYPESFIITCSTQVARDRILNSVIPIGSTVFATRPWTRVVHAASATLKF